MLVKALALMDREEIVATEVSSSLIPVLAVWLIGETSLHRVISPILRKLEGNKSLEDLASAVGNLEVLAPYLGAELLQGCPQVEENFSSDPLPFSLEVTFGSSLLPFWNNFTSLPFPPQPWPALTSSLSTFSSLAAALELLPMEPAILRPGGSLVASLLSVLGTKFGLSTFLPLFEAQVATGTLLPLLVAGMTQNSDLPLSSAALPLMIRHLSSNPDKLSSSFQEAVSTLASSSQRMPLVAWITELVHGENLPERLQAAELVGLLLPGQSGNEVWTLLQILVADSESEVVVASLSAVSGLLASPGLAWEEKEAVSLVLTKLLHDSRDNVVAAAISNIATLLPSWQGEGRDELLLVPLASVPLQWQASPKSPALKAALLAALAIVPELVTTEAVLSGHVLPGLVVLLEAMREEEGMEEAVLMVMAEVEGSRRRGAGRQRRESTQSGNSGQSAGEREEGKESVKTRVGRLLPKSTSMQLSPFWKK